MFAKIASLLSVLGVGLYFTGWIYRWAYFSYFQLEVTTLDLPFESFLIVPIQVFFGNISSGDISTILRTIKIAIATFIIIIISFKIIQFFTQGLANIINQIISWLLRKTLKTKHHIINRTLLSFPNFQPINDEKYDKVLINEIVIVAWLLTALFVLGQHQGKVDAIRDSRNETSSLPVVTLITPENQLPLGRKINDLTDDPNRSNFRVIGDIELYKELFLRDYNDKTQPKSLQIIWRLLFDTDGQYYIFPSLPKNAPSNVSPSVVIIQQSDRGEYVVILSPEAAP